MCSWASSSTWRWGRPRPTSVCSMVRLSMLTQRAAPGARNCLCRCGGERSPGGSGPLGGLLLSPPPPGPGTHWYTASSRAGTWACPPWRSSSEGSQKLRFSAGGPGRGSGPPQVVETRGCAGSRPPPPPPPGRLEQGGGLLTAELCPEKAHEVGPSHGVFQELPEAEGPLLHTELRGHSHTGEGGGSGAPRATQPGPLPARAPGLTWVRSGPSRHHRP